MQVFQGNRDRNTHVTNAFSVPVTARFIRILPVSFHAHISMRFELLGRVVLLQGEGEHKLGLQSGAVPDSAFSASSMYNYAHRPANARLNFRRGGGRTGGWSARQNNANQYIQVDFQEYYIMSGVIMQGRQDYSQWVTTYKVAHSNDGKRFSFFLGCDGNPMVFKGNRDRNTPVTAKFLRSATARYIRIHPVTWYGHISMRFEVLGTGPVIGEQPREQRLGVEDGRIKKEQLSASSCYGAHYCVDKGRLNKNNVGGYGGAWIAKRNDHSQWIQVDLKTDYLIQGVLTQGRSNANQWVKTYKVMFKANGDDEWQNVVGPNGQIQIFTGNVDRNGVVKNVLQNPVKARFVRIVPVTWQGHICMRFELVGAGPVTPDTRVHRLGIEDSSIPDFGLSASSCYGANTRFCAPRSRLNMRQRGYSYGGGWRSARNDPNQWIKVDLGAVYQITGVITQGGNEIRPRFNQWVTSFKLSYSLNGKDWLFAAACEDGDKVFIGNNDRDGEMVNDVNPPLMARFVRIHPLTWHRAINLRWELSGRGPFIGMTQKQKVSVTTRRIAGSVFTASSQYHARFSPSHARTSSRRSGGWIARTNDMNQWLQIKLPQMYTLTGVITQGHSHFCHWIEAFKVMYGEDGKNWKTVTQTGNSQPQIFDGNNDRRTKKTNMFVPPITASYVRIVPTDWAGHISMRAELLGSPQAPGLPPVVPASNLFHIVPIGMDSGVIPDARLSASTSYNRYHGAPRGRLHHVKHGLYRGAWCARVNNLQQYLQVDLQYPYIIHAVATQGRQDYAQWVTGYKVACSMDGRTYQVVKTVCQNAGHDKIFKANSNQHTVVTNRFFYPRTCRYVRIMPTSWYRHICMRMELYGEGPVSG